MASDNVANTSGCGALGLSKLACSSCQPRLLGEKIGLRPVAKIKTASGSRVVIPNNFRVLLINSGLAMDSSLSASMRSSPMTIGILY